MDFLTTYAQCAAIFTITLTTIASIVFARN